MQRRLPVLVAALPALTAVSTLAWPQGPIKLAADHAAGQGEMNDMASGEVRRIQPEQNTITLKHGAIRSISMPPMTMTFKVRDPALLDQVGDKVQFRAEVARGGTLYVTALESMR